MGSLLSVSENLIQHSNFTALIPSQVVQDRDTHDDAFSTPDWGDIVARIQEGVPSGMEDLYAVFGKGVRWMLLRQLGPEDLDDKVHDCFIIVAQAIQHGDLREPERLMGYVRTIVKRQIAAHIENLMHQRRTQADFEDTVPTISDYSEDPERALWERQRADIAKRVLQGISKRDREILNRFYVLEQPQEQICNEMNLTYNQFRLLKSRAKARFGEMGKRMALGMGRRLGKR